MESNNKNIRKLIQDNQHFFFPIGVAEIERNQGKGNHNNTITKTIIKRTKKLPNLKTSLKKQTGPHKRDHKISYEQQHQPLEWPLTSQQKHYKITQA